MADRPKKASSIVDELQDNSPFHPYRLPEMTKDHEITGSLIRNLIGVKEIPSLAVARVFKKTVTKVADEVDASGLSDQKHAIARAIVDHLAVPATAAGKAGATVPLLVPLTPALAQITAFTRTAGKPWNPGMYLKGMILRGCDSEDSAQDLWTDLGRAFAIGPWSETRNDIWATLIEEHLTSEYREVGIQQWTGDVDDIRTLSAHPGPNTLATTPCPARSFVSDLRVLIKLQSVVTRRQWISILDSFFRLVLSSDLLWIGRINRGLKSELVRRLNGNDAGPVPNNIAKALLTSFEPINVGDHVPTTLKREARGYIQSRMFVRLLLSTLRDRNPDGYKDIDNKGGLSNQDGLRSLFELTSQLTDPTLVDTLNREVSAICADEPGLMHCGKSGTATANFRWCIRHALGQRHTTDESDSHFDQGYWCKKSGTHTGAPWVFEPGPVALITFAHLACSGRDGLGTVSDFRHRVGQYGVNIPESDLNSGKIGRDIRSLGLVIDSPDAEGGMLLRSPFTRVSFTQ